MSKYAAYFRNIIAAIRGREPEIILMPHIGESFYLVPPGESRVLRTAITSWTTSSNGVISIDLVVRKESSK